METKKSYRVNLEPKRFMFREFGLVIGLLLLFMVFEFSISSATFESAMPNMSIRPDQDFTVVTKVDDNTTLNKPKPLKTPAQTIVEVTKPLEADTTSIIFNPDTVQRINPNDLVFDPISAPPVFFKLEKMPLFKGGNAALMKFISNNLEYPQELIDMNLEGVVTIVYIVDETGKVKAPEIKHSSNPILNRYALEVVSKIPDYTPGMQNGKAASAYISIPIHFKIEKK